MKNKAPNIFDQSDRTACMSISNRDDDDPLVHTTTINNTNEDIYEYTGKGEIPKDVTSIKLHRSLTSIPEKIFEGTNLQSIILNEGLVSIGNKTFANCTSLESIRIPSTVTSIGNNAFSHCTSLKEVTFKYSTKLHFGKRTFDNGSLVIGKRAFSGCTSLTSISIPPTLSVIDDELFTDCDSLKEIAFSEGVETVGRCSFGGCVSLESISFPSSLSDIGEDAFRNCTMLKEVIFNEGLCAVGRCSFGGCKALEHIKLPQSIEKVGKWAFRDCTQLQKVELGTQQRSTINQHTFAGCTKLDKSMIRTMMMVTNKMKGSLDLNTSTSASVESASLITYDEDDTTIDTKFTDETPVLERTSSERKKKKKKSRKEKTIDDSDRRSRRRKHKKSKSKGKLIDDSDRSGKSKDSDNSRRRKHHRKSKSRSRSKIDESERSSGKSRISRSQVDASVKSEKSEISGIW